MTAEELDAEMADYFVANKDGAADEGPKALTNGQHVDSIAATNPPQTAGFAPPAAAPDTMDMDIDMIE